MIVGENLLKKGFAARSWLDHGGGASCSLGFTPFTPASAAHGRTGHDREVLTGLAPPSIACALERAATSRHTAFRMPSTITFGSKMLTGHARNHPRDGQDADNETRARVALTTASRGIVTEASYRTDYDPFFSRAC